MDGLCNTACTRCRTAPRLPQQRWCRACLTASQRQRRAVRRAQATAVAPVTHLPDAKQVLTETRQPAEASPPCSHKITQALAAYRNAELAYRLATRRAWPRLPLAPDLRTHHLWRKAEIAKQRWLALVQGQRDTTGMTPSA